MYLITYCRGDEIMNEKIVNYLNGVFAPYDDVKSATELKADLLSDLHEKFNELKASGKDDDTAFQMTIESIGDIEETVLEVANLSRSLERKVKTNLSASYLPKSDFAGVVAHEGKFNASDLKGSDFSGADLTGSSFSASDLREANFDRANLTDCNLSVIDLGGASFDKTILVRTNFSKAGLAGTKFKDIKFVDVDLTMNDLTKTTFENCIFNGTNFTYCDLRGMSLEKMTFIGVKFDKAALNNVSFKGATLKNVSFKPSFAITNKFYRALKTINFEGAMIDKLTYAALKGVGAEVSKAIII